MWTTPTALAVMAAAILLASSAFSLQCFCGFDPCEDMTCCRSGQLATDLCGCCDVCARAEGEKCAETEWHGHGQCAHGLSCHSTCYMCDTVDEMPCIFPFTFQAG